MRRNYIGMVILCFWVMDAEVVEVNIRYRYTIASVENMHYSLTEYVYRLKKSSGKYTAVVFIRYESPFKKIPPHYL